MSDPFFSVVIPTYNRASFIKQSIESVLKQEFTEFEILVIDDGSADNTAQVVAEIKDMRIRYTRKNNEERAVARNVGARMAHGKYVNFLDSDDLLYPHHLRSAYEFINAQKNPEIFHLGYDVKKKDGTVLQTVEALRDINKNIITGNMLSCNGVFIRKDIIGANPFYEDRKLASLEDWELWIRMAARFPIYHVSGVTSSVIQHDTRSVVTGDSHRIKQKISCFLERIKTDSKNRAYFQRSLKKAEASAYTYAALHLAMSRVPVREVISYLWVGILANPQELFKRRFLAIVKHILYP